MLLHIVQQTFTFTNQLHQSAVSREILFVFLEMSADLADTFSQQGNLTLNGTGILLRTGVGF